MNCKERTKPLKQAATALQQVCLQHIQDDDDDFFDDNDHDDVMMIVMIMIVMTIAVKFLQDVCLQQVCLYHIHDDVMIMIVAMMQS